MKTPRYDFLDRLKYRVSFALRPSRNTICREACDLETASKVYLEPSLRSRMESMRAGLVRDGDGDHPYYSKFERFLKNNRIPYGFLEIHSSSWLEDAREFDIVIWRPMSFPYELDEAREKIHFLQETLKKHVYPSCSEIMFYENKVLQYYVLKSHGFPIIDTFITFDYDEARDWIRDAEYPFVSKIRTGSGSYSVSLIRNRRAAGKYVEGVFRSGRPTYWPFLRQKNYVFFQRYIENDGFDLRVIVIDEKNIFGYYREVPKRDFRASGMNTVVKKDLPKEAVKIAIEVTKKLGFSNLAVDLLRRTSDGKFLIIEASNFIKIETDEQLKIEGVPGIYRYLAETDSLLFEAGKYWPQELILRRYMETLDRVTFPGDQKGLLNRIGQPDRAGASCRGAAEFERRTEPWK